ncbi:hypothetical protein [Pelagicoccus sp. SDUM812005]|uniref:hypothetical protein n=1 Tax=Pelagicoccus sp. SDUM812005 TaxID=3041257 RepID=UPI00280EB067|nr:hypothetical protein [Pelagicoccus sp. SDUM812005]MDQ8182548.1 hypothetical protein [Pelagicoccus sp. SDUM812005]
MNDKIFNTKACVGIAAIVGGVSAVTVTLFAIFSPGNLAPAAWMVGSLCAMGLGLGYLISK